MHRPAPQPGLAPNDDVVSVEAGDKIEDDKIDEDVRQRAHELHEHMKNLWDKSHDEDYDEKALEHLSRVLFMKRKHAQPTQENVGTSFASHEETARAIAYVLQIRFDYLKKKRIEDSNRILPWWQRQELVDDAKAAFENTA